MGVIPQSGRVLADIVGSLPLLSRRPHAFMMLDVTSKQIGDGVYRLNTMQAALVIDDQGVTRDIERRLRDLLATYTDLNNGKIETLSAGDVRYYQLQDVRLPNWSVCEWGTVDHQFVIGFGEGAFTKVLDTLQHRAPSLVDDPWYVQAHTRCHGPTSGIELYADLERIQKRIGEVAKGRPEAVLRELHLDDADRLLWTVGFDGRALHSEVIGRTPRGPDHYLMLTGPPINLPQVTEAIPPEAKHYAAFRFGLGAALRDITEAYLSSQSPGKRENLRELWSRLEREFKFDFDKDLTQRLGHDLVIHNWPPHPLGVPLLFTIWISYTGDRASMAESVDRILKAADELVSYPAAQTRPSGLVPRLVRDEDGIWYVQLGLIGPAIAVADRWIVVSYSREAVKQNLAYLAQRAATQPAVKPSHPSP
jgi:hypothetical protein